MSHLVDGHHRLPVTAAIGLGAVLVYAYIRKKKKASVDGFMRLAESRSITAQQEGAIRPIHTNSMEITPEGQGPEGMTFTIEVTVADNGQRLKNAKPYVKVSMDGYQYQDTRETGAIVVERRGHYTLFLCKEPVCRNHLILASSSKIQMQFTSLSKYDFGEVWTIISAIDGIAMYDCGRNAGCTLGSHLHIEIVSRLNLPSGVTPLDLYLEGDEEFFKVKSGYYHVKAFAFQHCLYKFYRGEMYDDAGETMHRIYSEMMVRMGVAQHDRHHYHHRSNNGEEELTRDYNLIVSSEYMLLVPRIYGAVKGVVVKGLAFLGIVRLESDALLSIVTMVGPSALLQKVALPLPLSLPPSPSPPSEGGKAEIPP